MVKDILLPPETLLVQVRKQDNTMITPDGSTVLNEGDRLVLSARANGIAKDVELLEVSLDKEHEWIGKRISDVSLEAGN